MGSLDSAVELQSLSDVLANDRPCPFAAHAQLVSTGRLVRVRGIFDDDHPFRGALSNPTASCSGAGDGLTLTVALQRERREGWGLRHLAHLAERHPVIFATLRACRHTFP